MLTNEPFQKGCPRILLIAYLLPALADQHAVPEGVPYPEPQFPMQVPQRDDPVRRASAVHGVVLELNRPRHVLRPLLHRFEARHLEGGQKPDTCRTVLWNLMI